MLRWSYTEEIENFFLFFFRPNTKGDSGTWILNYDPFDYNVLSPSFDNCYQRALYVTMLEH